MTTSEGSMDPEVEREVLEHLAREWKLDLDGWRDYQSNFTTPVCQWFGVTCNEETRAVVAIELPRVNLSGSISAEIGILKSLNTLDLSGNDVYGAIPYEISQLPKLINLNLSSNNIEGSIETFHPDLKVLNVSHNELRGFEVDSDNLEVFDASHNRIGGFVPPSIGSLKKLKILDLGFNELYGPIPHTMGDMKELMYLFLNDNDLMSTIPLSLAREDLTLVQIFIEHNDLSGTVPSALSNLKSLKDLYIDGNKLTGDLPSSLCALGLNKNFIPGDSDSVHGCSAIACPINTVSPEGVYPCTPCGPQGTSPYLGHDKKCYHENEKIILEILYEKTNGPMWKDSTGWGVENVGICQYKGVECNGSGHVVAIDLSNNGLEGIVPDEIGFLHHLQVLDLSDNSLIGYIPSDLRFPPLQILNLANNKLEGLVPPMLCLTGDINGNGMNGDFNCDIIACSAGSWSPIGRSTPKGIEGEGGFEVHECKPCHRHDSSFIGSLQCGSLRVADDVGSVLFSAPEEDLLLTILTLCGTIGILVVIIVHRTRKIRRQELDDQPRNNGNDLGFDTDSVHSEATEAVSVYLTKLNIDESYADTEDDEMAGDLGRDVASQVCDADEEGEELRSIYSSASAIDDSTRQRRSSTATSSQQHSENTSSRRNGDLWLDIPSI